MDRAAALIEAVGAGPHPPRGPGDVLHEKRGEVHQNPIPGSSPDGEAPQRRRREGVLDSLAFGGVVTRCAETEVRLGHEHLGTYPVKAHDARSGELAPVDADVVGTQTGADPRCVQDIGVPLTDFEPDPAGRFLPVHRQEAVHEFHRRGLLRDRGRRAVLRPLLRLHTGCRSRDYERHGKRERRGQQPVHKSAHLNTDHLPDLLGVNCSVLVLDRGAAHMTARAAHMTTRTRRAAGRAPRSPPVPSLRPCCRGGATPGSGPSAATRPLPHPRAPPPPSPRPGRGA